MTMLQPLERDAYYRLLAESPDARFHQLWDHEAARTDGCRFEAVQTANGALALVRLKTLPVIGRGLAYILGGAAFGAEGASAAGLQEALTQLRDEYSTRRRLLLRVVPPLQPHRADDLRSAFSASGFRQLPGVTANRTILLQLSADPEAIKSGFKKRLRYGVGRSFRNEFVIEQGTSLDLYDRFLALYDDMWERKQFDTGVDPRWVRSVQESLPDQHKLHVRIARLGDDDMAATVHACTGDTVLYLLGATRAERDQPPARQYSAHRLHWDVIEAAIRDGVRYYDLGGINPEKNPGGYTFKEAFGGEDVTALGTWEVGSDFGSRVVVGFGERWRDRKRRQGSAP